MASKELENLKSMSLGDHLEELRTRLFLAIAGLFIGMIICLFFGKYLVDVLLIPYDNLVSKMEQDKIESEGAEEDEDSGEVVPGIELLIPYESLVSSMDQAKAQYEEQEKKEEAQKEIVNIRLLIPYENIIGTTKKPDIELSAIQPSESFMVYLKTSLFFGLLLTSPWVFYHIWAFISSGLYQKEKKYVHVVVPASATLFITGSVFFLMVVAKMMMGFFVKFDQLLGFTSRWSPQYYLSLVLTLTLVFGAAFQMPIAVIFANLMKLVSIEQLAKARKFVMLGLLFISAVATPPDVISQIALATPLYILYEGSIITCRILRRRREKNAQLA